MRACTMIYIITLFQYRYRSAKISAGTAAAAAAADDGDQRRAMSNVCGGTLGEGDDASRHPARVVVTRLQESPFKWGCLFEICSTRDGAECACKLAIETTPFAEPVLL